MATDPQQELELEREPFSEGGQAENFFATAALSQRLDLLHHLVQFSDLLLVIAADPGAGKSTLLVQAVAGADENWRVCRIDSTRAFDAQVLMDQLVAGLEVETEEDDPRERALRVRARLESTMRDGGITVIVIDDADRLSGEALAAVIELAADSERLKARFILAGLSDFAASVERAMAKRGAEEFVYRVEVPTFTLDQTGDYIHMQLHAAGLVGDSPFTARVIQSIFNASSGYPGRINTIAARFLENHAAKRRAGGGHTPHLRARDLFVWSRWLSAATVVLVVLVIVIVLLPPAAPERPAAPPVTETGAAAGPVANASPDTGPPRAEFPEAPRTLESRPVLDAPPETVTEEPAAVPAPAPPAPAPLGHAAAPIALPGPAVNVSSQSSARKPRPRPAPPHDIPSSRTPVAPAAAPRVPTPATVPKSQSATPVRVPRSRPSRAPAGGLHGVAWLRAQVPGHYTVQLAGTYSKAAMRRFIRKHDLGADAAWYRSTHRGRPWYVVVYGLYPTRAAARAALAALPRPLRKLKPWTRSIASVLHSAGTNR